MTGCLKPFDGLCPSACLYYGFNKDVEYMEGCLVVTENTSVPNCPLGEIMNQYHIGLWAQRNTWSLSWKPPLFLPLDLQKVFPPLHTGSDTFLLFFLADNSLRFQSPREQELSTLVLLPWRPPRRPPRWHQIAPAPLPALSPASLSSRALMVWRRTAEAFLETKW